MAWGCASAPRISSSTQRTCRRPCKPRFGGTSYLMQISRRGALHWQVSQAQDSFNMKFAVLETGTLAPGSVELIFRFDPRVTPTTVLPSVWKSDGSFLAPLIISAPDFGQMLMRVTPAEGSSARLEGSRAGPHRGPHCGAAPDRCRPPVHAELHAGDSRPAARVFRIVASGVWRDADGSTCSSLRRLGATPSAPTARRREFSATM